MPKENIIPIENKKPVAEVRFWDYEIKTSKLSPAARSKIIKKYGSDYVSESREDYGPCRNSLCGCSCSSYTCKCESYNARVVETGASFTAHGRKWEEEIEPKNMEDLVLRVGGQKTERKVGGQVSGSLFGHKDSDGELKVLSGTVSSEFERGSFKVKASADLYNVKSDGVQVRVGVGVDTGISTANDTFEAKAIGFGFSVGKQTGISTPVGEIKFDTEDCVIQ